VRNRNSGFRIYGNKCHLISFHGVGRFILHPYEINGSLLGPHGYVSNGKRGPSTSLCWTFLPPENELVRLWPFIVAALGFWLPTASISVAAVVVVIIFPKSNTAPWWRAINILYNYFHRESVDTTECFTAPSNGGRLRFGGCTKLYKIKYIILYGLKLKFVKNSWSGCWCNVTAAPVKWNWILGRFGGFTKFNFGCTKLYKIKYIILLDYNLWFWKCECWGNAPVHVHR
jgi:hypothetical protein